MTYDFIIEINNCIDPSLIIYFKGDNTIKASKMTVNFGDDGKLLEANKIAAAIKSRIETNGKSCLLIFNLYEAFSINRFYPSLGVKKSRKLFDANIKEEFPSLNEYKTFECEYDGENYSMYSIYAIKNNIINFYKDFLLKCGFSSIAYKSKGQYLIEEYESKYSEDNFAIYHYENDLLYFNVCVDGKLIYSITCLDNQESENRMSVSCIDGTNYALKRNIINTVYTNKDVERICDYDVKVKKVGKNFSQEGEIFE